MLSFLINFAHAFIPVALLMGMLLAQRPSIDGKKAIRPFALALACGLMAGGILYFVALRQETFTATRTFIVAAGILAALLKAGTLLLPWKGNRPAAFIDRGAGLFFTSALAAVATFSFSTFATERALTAVSILNTGLLLNIGGIMAGLFLVAFLVPLTSHLAAKGAGKAVLGVFLFFCILPVVPWSAETLLGLMRLEMLELTSGRLSYVAKVTKYSSALPYINLSIPAALALLALAGRSPFPSLPATARAERRKARSRALFEKRWLKSAATSIGLVLALFLYHDLYASRPPKISTPITLEPDAAGLIRVPIEEVADGTLHRYAYVTDDGHVVRFFLIDRLSGSSGGLKKIGVVFDACMLCGDMGYLQEKNEVICIACNVRIFLPSIGKAGGCNPIPLRHRIEEGAIVVSAEDLDQGARYFSQVVDVKVKDPVTGKELISRDAPHRYEYQGRTYFFESEASLEKFRASPETYFGKRQSRYFRAQGFQKS